MELPTVAILIPCYNEALYLEDCLKNVLAQSYPNTEIIACDDASSDDTWDVLNSYGQDITTFRNEKNIGPSATRNRLLGYANSEFVHFQDADDLMHPRFIEYMFPWVRYGDYDMVLCQVDNFYNDDPDDIRDGFFVRPANTNEHPYAHIVDIAGHATNSIYNRKILAHVGGFNETIRYAEDYDLHLRLGEQGARIAVIGQCLVKHRCRSVPRTFTMDDLMDNAFLLLKGSVERMSTSELLRDEAFARRLSLKFWHAARVLTDSGKRESANEAYRFSRKLFKQGCPMGSAIYKLLYYVFGFRLAEYARSTKSRIG